MRLERIEAVDFAMHAALDVDLSGVNAVAIVGENGAGKSRLLDAVLWSLFGRPTRGRPDQLIRRGQRSMWVRTTWRQAEHEIVVKRVRELDPAASMLELHVDGERHTKHTIAETDEEIVRLTGLPLNVLWSGPLMAQGESDALMRADPRERKDVLGRLFGLDEYEAFHEEAKRRLDAAQRSFGALDLVRQRLEEEALLGAELPDRLDASAADAAASRRVLDTANEQLTVVRERVVAMEWREERIKALDEEIGTAQRTLDEQMPNREQLRVQVERRATGTWQMAARDLIDDHLLAEAEKDATALAEARREHEIVGAEIVRLRSAMEAAERDGLCDHCPYGADARMAPAKIRSAQTAEALLQSSIDELAGADDHLAELRREQIAITAEQERFKAHQRELALLDSLAATLENVESVIASAERTIRQRNGERMRLQQDMVGRDELVEELAQATTAVVEASAAVRRDEQVYATVRAEHDRWLGVKEELATLQPQIAELERKIATLEVVRRMFHRDGIPLLVLDRGLPLIEARANEILGRLPGGMRISLVTQRETKQGSLRDTLDVIVEQDASETVYDVLSGAERFRVDFALRLGVSEVLARQRGRTFETLWLDEPFSAQSPTALETVLECLSAVADDFGLMVVTTHQPDVADRFPARLVVSKEDGIATVALRT